MDRTLTSLKKIKDPFFRGEEFRMAETSQTNHELIEQKSKLLQEINKLSNIYFSLKRGSEKVKKDIVGFETDRIKTLEVLGREVNLELDEEAEVLKKRSLELDQDQLFLIELSDYVSELMPIMYSLCVDYEEKLEETEKMTLDTSKESKKLKKLIKEEEGKKEKSETLLEVAEMKHTKADNLLKEVQEGIDQKKKEWERKDDKLEIERAELRNMKMLYKGKEDKLKKREKALGDRERAFERKVAEMV